MLQTEQNDLWCQPFWGQWCDKIVVHLSFELEKATGHIWAEILKWLGNCTAKEDVSIEFESFWGTAHARILKAADFFSVGATLGQHWRSPVLARCATNSWLWNLLVTIKPLTVTVCSLLGMISPADSVGSVLSASGDGMRAASIFLHKHFILAMFIWHTLQLFSFLTVKQRQRHSSSLSPCSLGYIWCSKTPVLRLSAPFHTIQKNHKKKLYYEWLAVWRVFCSWPSHWNCQELGPFYVLWVL